MRKSIFYLAIAAMAAIFSCSKEASEVTSIVKNEPVSLSLGLNDGTKVALEYGSLGNSNGLKTSWEVGDNLTVSFWVDATHVSETFVATEVAADGKTATFYNENSQFRYQTTGGWEARYANFTDPTVQKGNLADLPVYLEAKDIDKDQVSGIVLENPISYLHFVLTSETEQTFTHGYLRVTSGSAGLLGGDASDVIKVAFDTPVTVNSVAKDVYVAANFDGTSTKGSTFQFILMNADYDLSKTNVYDGLQSASISWTAAKDYVAQKVYKKEGTLSYVSGQVGKSDNSDVWGSEVYSDAYAVQKGSVMTLEFVNHSSKGGNYNNWLLFAANSALGSTGYAEHFVLRADNYAWDAKSNSFDSPADFPTLWSNYDWGVFLDAMDGAKITMTVEYTTTGSLIINAVQVSADGNYTFNEKFNRNISVADNSQAVVFLKCDGSHYEMTGLSYGASTKVVESLSTLYNNTAYYPYYVYDAALDLAVVGGPKKNIFATYTDGDVALVDASLLTDCSGAVVAATAGNQTVSVKYNGQSTSLTLPVVLGTGAFGSTTLDNAASYSPFFGDVPAGGSVTKTMYVYSSCANNWASPCTDAASAGFAKFYITGRMDHWSWGEYSDSATKSSNWNWDKFTAYQNHCKIVLTLTNNTSTGTIRYDVTYWDGETHFQEYAGFTIDNAELAYRCFTENSYVVAID